MFGCHSSLGSSFRRLISFEMDHCNDFDTGDCTSPDAFKLAARLQFQSVSNIQIIINEHVHHSQFDRLQNTNLWFKLLTVVFSLFLLDMHSWEQSPRHKQCSMPLHHRPTMKILTMVWLSVSLGRQHCQGLSKYGWVFIAHRTAKLQILFSSSKLLFQPEPGVWQVHEIIEWWHTLDGKGWVGSQLARITWRFTRPGCLRLHACAN